MNKVITISLNGNAYQLEEAGYERLRVYLDAARAKLSGNPDVEEIIRDLEQAIADKLRIALGNAKTVANDTDVEKALREMGPVDTSTSTNGAENSNSPKAESPKRLYRLDEGKVIFGICSGLAAYFNVDVVLMRVLFVALAVVTSGGWILVYFIMMLIIPEARTSEARAAAHGATTLTAREIIDRAKNEYAKWDKGQWRAHKQEVKNRWRYARTDHTAHNNSANFAEHRAYAKHARRPSVVGEIMQVALLGVLIWGAYTYIPSTHPFFDKLGGDISYSYNFVIDKLAGSIKGKTAGAIGAGGFSFTSPIF